MKKTREPMQHIPNHKMATESLNFLTGCRVSMPYPKENYFKSGNDWYEAEFLKETAKAMVTPVVPMKTRPCSYGKNFLNSGSASGNDKFLLHIFQFVDSKTINNALRLTCTTYNNLIIRLKLNRRSLSELTNAMKKSTPTFKLPRTFVTKVLSEKLFHMEEIEEGVKICRLISEIALLPPEKFPSKPLVFSEKFSTFYGADGELIEFSKGLVMNNLLHNFPNFAGSLPESFISGLAIWALNQPLVFEVLKYDNTEDFMESDLRILIDAMHSVCSQKFVFGYIRMVLIRFIELHLNVLFFGVVKTIPEAYEIGKAEFRQQALESKNHKIIAILDGFEKTGVNKR